MHPTVPLRISQTSSNTAHCASTFIITIHIHATYNKQNSMLHCESYPAQWVTQSAVYSAVEQQLTPSWCLPQVGFLCLLCNLTNQWISYNLPTDLIDSQMLSVAIYITSFYMFFISCTGVYSWPCYSLRRISESWQIPILWGWYRLFDGLLMTTMITHFKCIYTLVICVVVQSQQKTVNIPQHISTGSLSCVWHQAFTVHLNPWPISS